MATSDESLMAWLRDAHAMEMQAIRMLEGQVSRLENYPELRARMQQHLEETRRQENLIRGCIERRGGSVSMLKDAAAQLTGLGQAVSGLFVTDEVVKGSMASYTFEHMEISSYRSLIATAEVVGDAETKRVCESILREEEAMAGWLAEHLPGVTKAYLQRESAGRPAKR